jgi:hypothetical protein
MDNSEVLQKLENIEILLTANIESMNDPQKTAKEAQILIQASKELNSTSKEIKGLLAQEKELLEGFKPTVEHQHYTIDMKNPLYWVIGCILFFVISFVTTIYFKGKYEDEKDLTEKYKKESENKDDNYMKYKYLELFGDDRIFHNLKAFDKDYDKNWKVYDNKTNLREQALNEAEKARKEAELKTEEAKRLLQHQDSLIKEESK